MDKPGSRLSRVFVCAHLEKGFYMSARVRRRELLYVGARTEGAREERDDGYAFSSRCQRFFADAYDGRLLHKKFSHCHHIFSSKSYLFIT